MRRLIAIFLLVLLPLQAVWAAVEPYCLHESNQGDTHHLGHHEHQHHAEAAEGVHQHSDDQADSPASAMLDHDHHCCSAVSLLPTAALSLPGPLPLAELAASPLAGYTSFDATRIERPNWIAAT